MFTAGLFALSLFAIALGRPTFTQTRGLFSGFRGGHNPCNGHSSCTPIARCCHAGINFSVGLKPQNITGLFAALTDVSDPSSPRYGQHLSKDEVASFVAPKPEDISAVTGWLKANNVSYRFATPAQDVLRFELPVKQANALLNADYIGFLDETTNTTTIGTESYSVPPDVAPGISFFYPTDQFIPPLLRAFATVVQPGRGFRRPLSRPKRDDIPASCSDAITPECLQALYHIPATPANASGNSLGVSGFLNEVASQSDLQQFLGQFRPDITNGTFSVENLDGGSDAGAGTIEASLDVQYTVGLATGVPTSFVSVGNNNQDGIGGFFDVIKSLLEQDAPPLVLTTSFGMDEDVFQQSPELAQSLCNAYAQLGARGTSVIFASGDGGVSGSQPRDSCEAFVPTFPSSCPFVTSVGSTQGVPETAAPFSSGGFSNLFARPDYQSAAVDAYLATLGSTNANLFNATGRAYPDVSTQGAQFQVNVAGTVQPLSGTSASSPTFASVVALLNDRRLAAHLSPLGFLNPLLYSNASAAFNDITTGSNPGCGTQGFPAAAGWDPVTGLGTPDFDKLASVVIGST
ncbi:family S53 protease-like protein [Daedaleopsis nitida]|nr:family S53 protease-like protein [Daedaleopsis nitida]